MSRLELHPFRDTSTSVSSHEDVACVGDADGLIGPWHFARVTSARDGNEMMGAAELDGIREARAKQSAAQQAAVAAKAAAEAEKRLRKDHRDEQRALEEERKAKKPKFNPYLAHLEEASRKRKYEDEDEEEDY